jgi:hypothetical protein
MGLHRLLTVCTGCQLCRPHATYVHVGCDSGGSELRFASLAAVPRSISYRRAAFLGTKPRKRPDLAISADFVALCIETCSSSVRYLARRSTRSTSRMVTERGSNLIQPRAAKSARALLTVSRDAPTSWASSSWVRS